MFRKSQKIEAPLSGLAKFIYYLTIRLRARVFYERTLNEAQQSWLSLKENEGE